MKEHEIATLYRSYSPKMSHYFADGHGRDVYINHNNGGFWSQGVRTFAGKEYNKEISTKYQFKALSKNVAPLKYLSDGSGRDSYVIHESGGLRRDQKSLNEISLKDFLRNNDAHKINFKPKISGDKFARAVSYCSKAEFESKQQLKIFEKKLVSRLYENEKHKFVKTKTAFNYNKLSISNKNNDNCYSRNNLPLLKTETEKDHKKLNTRFNLLSSSDIPLQTDVNFFKSSIDRINNYEKFKIIFNSEMNKKLNIKEK
jgi:hypothetical protein